jgi:membrane protein implicated in regulation of membrane protease activity
MFIMWILGFTHLLGGPYFLFKVIFWIAILPFIISAVLFILVLLKIKKNINKNTGESQKQETLHVDATIKE